MALVAFFVSFIPLFLSAQTHRDCVLSASQAPTSSGFDERINPVKKGKPESFAQLMKHPLELWADHAGAVDTVTCGQVASNVAETSESIVGAEVTCLFFMPLASCTEMYTPRPALHNRRNHVLRSMLVTPPMLHPASCRILREKAFCFCTLYFGKWASLSSTLTGVKTQCCCCC